MLLLVLLAGGCCRPRGGKTRLPSMVRSQSLAGGPKYSRQVVDSNVRGVGRGIHGPARQASSRRAGPLHYQEVFHDHRDTENHFPK